MATAESTGPFIEDILKRFRAGESVRQSLPGGGVLSIDRGLPFLLVYREPSDRDDPGTERMVTGEASYLVSRGGPDDVAIELVRRLARAGSAAYGAFLVLEIWSTDEPEAPFAIVAPPRGPAPEAVDKLVEALEPVRQLRPGLRVTVRSDDDRHPPDLPPLLSVEESWQSEVLLLGLELPAIYRNPDTDRIYPRFVRAIQRFLSRALRQALYEFIRVQTSSKLTNYLALGTRTLPDAVWSIDSALVALERTFDLLLLTSPVNFDPAWEHFKRSRFQATPEFHYRLLPIDPDLLKRELFAIEIEAIDDPAIAELFQEKREELDTLLTMLADRGSPRFRHNSHRLYGMVDDGLLQLAEGLLGDVEPPGRWTGGWVDAEGFRQAAEKELTGYAMQTPGLANHIEIRRDVNGLMVSNGNLLIGEGVRLRPDRVAPLIHHEVGTHVLTHINGSGQPLKQLSTGLANYDELQEGLAVLAEYLVGGLDPLRMRLLAARVVAARSVEEGGEFIDTFRLLTGTHGYTPGGAWNIATRVHASGGFTRDLIYLRGLVNLVELLRRGGEIEPLYIGKIAQKHIPLMEELRHREVLSAPRLLPRFLEQSDTRDRLEAVRNGITLTDMICPNP